MSKAKNKKKADKGKKSHAREVTTPNKRILYVNLLDRDGNVLVNLGATLDSNTFVVHSSYVSASTTTIYSASLFAYDVPTQCRRKIANRLCNVSLSVGDMLNLSFDLLAYLFTGTTMTVTAT